MKFAVIARNFEKTHVDVMIGIHDTRDEAERALVDYHSDAQPEDAGEIVEIDPTNLFLRFARVDYEWAAKLRGEPLRTNKHTPRRGRKRR